VTADERNLIESRVLTNLTLLRVAQSASELADVVSDANDRGTAVDRVARHFDVPPVVAEHVLDARLDLHTRYRIAGLEEELALLRQQLGEDQ
jgi:hypothetical protein